MRRRISTFARWIEYISRSWQVIPRPLHRIHRQLRLEPLGKRDLLAIIPLSQVTGSISGKVYNDVDADNTLDSGELGIANVTVDLFNDLDGDGVLDVTDTQVGGSQITNATGDYVFSSLPLGKYLVRETLPSGFNLVVNVANTNPRALNLGIQTQVDDFNTGPGGAAAETVADTTGANPNNSSFLGSSTNILGGEREVTVQVTSTTGAATIGIDSTASPDLMSFSFDSGTTAKASVLWDGSSDSGAVGNALALGGLNLTALGNSGFVIHKGADRISSITLLVHTDASNVLKVDVPLTDSGGALETTGPVYVPFTDLVNSLGTAGTVTSVKAIELLINESTALDGEVDFLSLLQTEIKSPAADFANQQTLTLGNLVWHDLNNNGVFDTGETKLKDVTVNLYRDNGTTPGSFDSGDTLVDTKTTDASGNYLFTGLAAGDYIVQIPQAEFDSGDLVGFISSRPGNVDASIDPDNDTNDDDNGVQVAGSGVVSKAITLAFGTEPVNDGDTDNNTNLSLDFGVVRTFTLGNFVFNDVNNNGTKDSGDAGIDNVDVILYRDDGTTAGVIDANDTVIGTKATSGGGFYTFTGLLPGKYIAQIPQAELSASGSIFGFRSSLGTAAAPNPDTTDLDNDDNGAPGTATGLGSGIVTQPITLSGDEANTDGDNNPATNLTLDFGVSQVFSLGNTVWIDANNDGKLNNGEVGKDGVSVNLYRDTGTTAGVIDAGDTLVGTVDTASGGKYLFTGLQAGNYIAQIPAFEFDTADSKASLVGFSSSLGAGAAPDPDPALDLDDNGQPGTATGIGAGIVSLPITLASDSTNADGDSDPNSNLTLDFGVVQLLSVGNLVWVDTDNSGTFNGAEVGKDGVKVQLYRDNGATAGSFDTSDTFVREVTTAGGGKYVFTDLTADNYIIRIPQTELDTGGSLAGFSSSLGSAAAPDPDTNTANDDDNGAPLAGQGIVTPAFALARNTLVDGDSDSNSNLTIDLGVVQLLTLGNLVWRDLNNNGTRDGATETGIADVDIKLFRDNGTTAGTFDSGDTLVSTTKTDANGLYQFTDLTPGDYLIQIPQSEFDAAQNGSVVGFTSSLGTAAAPDPDNDLDNDDNGEPSTGNGVVTRAITLAVGAEPTTDGDGANGNQTLDIGLVPANASLAGFVYVDADDDGVFDTGETPIPNVTVTLTGTDINGATVNRTATTKSDGSYLFDNLVAGTYTVTETQPAGFRDGRDTAGSTGGTVTNDVISAIPLAAGQNSVNNNFGERTQFSKRLFLGSAIPVA